jgi:hypothetical protein
MTAIIPSDFHQLDRLAAAQYYATTLGWAIHPLLPPDRGEPQERGKKPILKVPSAELDWWSVTHIVFFAILAFLFPDHLFELFVLGILWEIIEDGLAPRTNKGVIKCDKEYKNSWLNTFKVMWCDNIAREKDYWYGKWDDVFSNTLGLLIGHFIRSNNLWF